MDMLSPWKRLACLPAITALLSGCDLDESKIRIDVPTAPDKMRAEFDVALPSSAKNMYFVQFAAGLQTLEEYVRFEVAPADREQAIQAIMAWGDVAGPKSISLYERKPIAPSDIPKPSASIGRVDWWNPNAIKKGYSYVKNNNTRTFLVDEETNIVYFYWTD